MDKTGKQLLIVLASIVGVAIVFIIIGEIAKFFEAHPCAIWYILGIISLAVLEGLVLLGIYIKNRFFP